MLFDTRQQYSPLNREKKCNFTRLLWNWPDGPQLLGQLQTKDGVTLQAHFWKPKKKKTRKMYCSVLVQKIDSTKMPTMRGASSIHPSHWHSTPFFSNTEYWPLHIQRFQPFQYLSICYIVNNFNSSSSYIFHRLKIFSVISVLNTAIDPGHWHTDMEYL